MSNSSVQEQGYVYFLMEAPDLLQAIEQELLTLPEEHTTAKVHNLMRAAHTLKGSAANVGLSVIQTVAHSLEDVVKVLYNPSVVIDTELQTLLLEAYECLRLPLMARIQPGGSINEQEILDRAKAVFAQVKAKLGDLWNEQVEIPSSIELGFDIVESMFEMGVQQRLEELATALENPDVDNLSNFLRSEAEVFVGLAESLNLPGFGAIAQNTIAALDAHPEKVLKIARIALADFQSAQKQVLAGDRTLGGTPSPALQQLAGKQDVSGACFSVEQFEEFIKSDLYNTNKPLHPKERNFYLVATRYCLEWFLAIENIAPENLSLTLLVPKVTREEQEAAATYVDGWLGKFLESEKNEGDRHCLCLYRHAAILKVILAVAKFLYNDETNDPQEYRDIPLIQILRHQLTKVVSSYKQHPPITDAEKKWLELSKPQQLISEQQQLPATNSLALNSLGEENALLEQIWGKQPAESTEIELSTPQTVAPSVTEIELSTPQAVVPSARELQISETTKHREEQPIQSPKSKIPTQTVRVDLEELERLNYLAGNLLINQNRQISQDEQLQQAVQDLRGHLKQHQQTLNQLRDWYNLILALPDFQGKAVLGYTSKIFGKPDLSKKARPGAGNKQQTNFDTLELDEHTELSNLFHSALEDTVQLEAATEAIDQIAKQLSYTLEKQQRLLSHVRKDMTAVQMLPLGDILERFLPMIQQLARAKSKPVELKISGSHVLIDKAIAEKLYEPLLHLVRNAFDHGIESPDARRSQGKPPEGKIEIRAYHQGDRTIISVRDDGKGLDFDAIRHRAVEMNLVSAEQASQLPRSALLDFLFAPGFSTRKAVSDLSGRGIGLDIVKNQLEALRGTITVESQPQMGTTFSLQIPFSLISANLFICQDGGVTYALSSDTIAKIVLPQPDRIQVLEGKKVLMYGQGDAASTGGTDTTGVVPVYKLSAIIKYTSVFARSLLSADKATPIKEEKRQTTDNTQLLLLQGNTKLLALEVDQILGEQELVIRPLGTAITPPSYVFGCSILGDGRLILAIDGAVLIEQAFSPLSLSRAVETASTLTKSTEVDFTPSPPPRLSPASPLPTPKTVLVVDDSLSYRQTLALNLQKAGYQVLQAQDGLEALEQLRQYSDIGLVLCDIEMPNMNGFEFLNQKRQNPALAPIPVVMLTSRISEKHRLLALSLGAAAYLTKPYIEKELLTTIAQLHPARSL